MSKKRRNTLFVEKLQKQAGASNFVILLPIPTYDPPIWPIVQCSPLDNYPRVMYRIGKNAQEWASEMYMVGGGGGRIFSMPTNTVRQTER